jgi:hypothetical protein
MNQRTIRFTVGETITVDGPISGNPITFNIVARSTKFITVHNDGRQRRIGLRVEGDREYCWPLGRYVDAPIAWAGGWTPNWTAA